MKKLLFGLIALGSIFAQASTIEMSSTPDEDLFREKTNDSKSYFDILGELYEQGTLPDILKISNKAWSGRCFDSTTPNEPTNAGLIVRNKKPADVGPIRTNEVQMFEALAYRNHLKVPNYYDNFTIDQLIKPGTPFFDLNFLPTHLEFKQFQKLVFHIRASDKYIVIKGIEVLNEASQPSEITNSPFRCYFFIPGI
jgi:hypothetical protein